MIISDKKVMGESRTQSGTQDGDQPPIVTSAIQSEQYVTGSGVNHRPNWKALPPVLRSAPLEYWKQWEISSNGRHNEYSRVDLGRDWFGTYYGFSYTSKSYPNYNSSLNSDQFGPEQNEADYKAKIKLFDSMKGEGANVANMFAERHQTVKGVENVVNTLVHTVRDLRHGRLASAVRRMGGDPLSARKLRKKDIADQWLSLQYGWKPLLSDAYDLVTQAHKREETRLCVLRASSGHHASYAVPRQRFLDGSAPYPYSNADMQKQTGTWACDAIVKYMIRAQPNLTLATPAALGLTNPLVVAWEVTPWSFVVDWFLPVGSYLEQLTADHGWDFYDGCRSVLIRSNASWQWNVAFESTRPVGSGRTETYTNTASSYADYKFVRFSRSTLTGFPTPPLPRFKNPVSTGHLANSLALLSQLFSGGPVRRH